MSIPVEKRDLGDGWALTCHGQDGGGLTLTDVTIKRENLVCQVLGGYTLFFPMFSTEDEAEVLEKSVAETAASVAAKPQEEESILDHITELILNAQRYGCWQEGVGGVAEVRRCACFD